ncbi:MAG: acyltransferase family protein [Acidobacteria bacterium]|nr:acyltransferase family protein [Acidobacteriota bacterium]
MPGAPSRRSYIDWLRGLAVLIMIEAHTLDAWTRAADRGTRAFGYGAILGGFAAPLFLFLAGVAVPLAMSAKQRRGADLHAASRAVRRRGWEVFGLALLFRLQAKLLGGGGWHGLLKVDILNIMGPAIAASAAVLGAISGTRARAIVLGAATAALALSTPAVRAASWPAPLPDFLEGYLRPRPGLTNFTFFPWAAFLTGGACVGAVLAALRDEAAERRANLSFLAVGALLAVGGYAASFLPSPFPSSSFWTSSPAFFMLRAGLLLLALPLAFAWGRRPTAHHWSPVQQLGRTSLFVYWIHIEMAYGWLSRPWHRNLSLTGWMAAYAGFVILLLFVSVLKDALVRRWRSRTHPAAALTGA